MLRTVFSDVRTLTLVFNRGGETDRNEREWKIEESNEGYYTNINRIICRRSCQCRHVTVLFLRRSLVLKIKYIGYDLSSISRTLN